MDPAGTTTEAGNTWLTQAPEPTVRVASVLIPHAWNLLLNPRHPGATQAEILTIEAFNFDPRLWHPLGGEF